MVGLLLGRGLILPLLLTLLLGPAAHDGGSDRTTAPFQPSGYEIGSVGSDDCVLGKFILHNAGDQGLIIRSLRRNCACYKIVHTVNRLQPGESTILTFELTFPRGKRLRNAIFYLLSDDREKPLRLFIVKLKQSDDPDFVASKPNQIILWMLDSDLPGKASLEAINRRLRVVEIQELPELGGQKRYALEFEDGTDIPQVAKAYLEHPSVGLVLLRAGPEATVTTRENEPSPPPPVAPISKGTLQKKQPNPRASSNSNHLRTNSSLFRSKN